MDELSPEVEALRKVPFFEELTPEDLDRIARIGQRRTFEVASAVMLVVRPAAGPFPPHAR